MTPKGTEQLITRYWDHAISDWAYESGNADTDCEHCRADPTIRHDEFSDHCVRTDKLMRFVEYVTTACEADGKEGTTFWLCGPCITSEAEDLGLTADEVINGYHPGLVEVRRQIAQARNVVPTNDASALVRREMLSSLEQIEEDIMQRGAK